MQEKERIAHIISELESSTRRIFVPCSIASRTSYSLLYAFPPSAPMPV